MKKIFIIFFIGFTLLVLNFELAFAARPLFTEDCWTTEIGKPVIESGTLFISYRDDTGYRELSTSLKVALLSQLDVSIALPYVSRGSYSENYDGLSDGTFKVKYNFYNKDYTEGASLQVGYMLNTGDNSENLSTNRHDITTMLIYSNDLGIFNYHLNFAYTFADEPNSREQNDFLIYNAALVKPINERSDAVAEIQYGLNTNTRDVVSEVAIGMNYRYSEYLIFDAAIGCGLNENSSSSNFTFGLTYFPYL